MPVTERQYAAMQRSHANWERMAQYHAERREWSSARKARQEAEALRLALASVVVTRPLMEAR